MMNTCSLILCALLLTAPAATAAVESINNNFTMIDPDNNAFAGANDVFFSWDGSKKTSVAVSHQVSNAKISSSCPFFSVPWKAHDAAVYGLGAYTVYSGCPAGSPGCGTGAPIKFTVKKGEIGIHLLLDWNDSVDIDVVNVMKPNAVASPVWARGCGSHSACTVWTWASYDFDGDGVNGTPVVEGPFAKMNINFNLGARAEDPCCDSAVRCNDNNACTTDTCDRTTGLCVHTPIACDDNNVCTAASCDPAKGCVHTPIGCDDNNACTVDSCNPAAGCVHAPVNCDDNNACTTDSCNPATGCIHTPVICNDNNLCTIDTCNPARGCVHSPVAIDDNNGCTADACDPATGIITHTPIACDDNDVCTVDTCDPSTGCVHTPIVCDDNNACTTDRCNPASGCVFTPIACDDNDVCTIDSCDPLKGCVHTPIVCDDHNACTTDTCDPARGCVFTPVKCPDNQACDPATGDCVVPRPPGS